jgi:hypothetical protein
MSGPCWCALPDWKVGTVLLPVTLRSALDSSSQISFRKLTIILGLMLCLSIGACTSEDQTDPASTLNQDNVKRQLNSLPYVTRTKVREENKGLRGVILNDEERAIPGLNLYGSLTRREAYLRTMSGDLVHTWSAEGVFTDRADFPLPAEIMDAIDGPIAPGLTVAEVHGDHLLAIESLSGLVKLDWNSDVIFALENNAHHDVDTTADGTIYVLTAVPRWVDTGSGNTIIVDDVIERLSADGVIEQSYSIFEILASDPNLQKLVSGHMGVAMHWFKNMDQWKQSKTKDKDMEKSSFDAMFNLYDEVFVQKTRTLKQSHQLYVLFLTPADILHCNTLQVLPAREDGLWKEGNVLVSVRNMDLIVVLDLEEGKVVWAWGPGEISRQHQPSLLANGNILIFNNGTANGRSGIIELNPATREIVQTYGDTPETKFFCGAMGGVQGLPNQHYLITNSAIGRVFELDHNHQVVWDFFNPEQGYNPFGRPGDDETIEAIYRLVRVDESSLKTMVGRD